LGQGTGGSGVAGGAGGEGAACSPPVYSQGLPAMSGCYAGTDQGWVQVPCVCDLWLENTTHDPLGVSLTLSQVEASSSSTDAADPELDIEDTDSAFYAVWSTQAAAGAPITVSHSDDTTAVKLQAESVVLGPVSVAACSFITGIASMKGYDTTLSMHADFLDATGSVVLTTDGTCFNPTPSR
jgi:hypothetical protein